MARITLKVFIRDFGANILGCVLRIAVFVPFTFYNGLANNHWDLIKNHPELHLEAHGLLLAAGESIAAKWGRIGCYWNFAVFIPAVYIAPPFNIVFGIIDTVITVYVSIAIHYQTSYVPHSINDCHGAHDWLRPTGANESFFDTAARLNATTTTSYYMCKSFVEEWKYGLSIVSIYATIAFATIVASIHTGLYNYTSAKNYQKSCALGSYFFLTALPGMLILCFWGFVYCIPALLFRCLPLSFVSRTRYARRVAVKAGTRLEEKGEINMRALKRKNQGKERYDGGKTGKQVPLADFLGIYDVLVLVVRDLHYVDIINLSLASKSVREAVLPSHDYEQRLSHFRIYSCPTLSLGFEETKAQCWICTNQICDGCGHSRVLQQTTPYFHLDNCRPYCTPCYLAYIHRPRTMTYRNTPRCRCAPPTKAPNFFQRYMTSVGFPMSTSRRLENVTRVVCEECAKYTDTETDLLSRRERRTKWELKLTDTIEMSKRSDGGCRSKTCSRPGCARPLGKGPRWWICKMCNKECTSSLHGAWGRRHVSTATAVGEQAV